MEKMIQLDQKYQSTQLKEEKDFICHKSKEVMKKLSTLDNFVTLLVKLSTESAKELKNLEAHTFAVKIEKKATVKDFKENVRNQLGLSKEIANGIHVFGYNEIVLKDDETIEKTLLIECITDKNMNLKLPKPYGGVAWISF